MLSARRADRTPWPARSMLDRRVVESPRETVPAGGVQSLEGRSGGVELTEGRGADPDPSRLTAGVGGQGEPEDVGRLLRAPEHGALPGAEIAQPVQARVAEAAGPV